MLILGIDDVGRGAVIGPLVICGLVVEKDKEKLLKRIGVKDSKELTPGQRKKLAKDIERVAKDIILIKIPACKIDRWRQLKRSLDLLEAEKMAEIIEIARAEKVYLDALTTRPKKFEKLVKSFLRNKKIKIVAENFADKKYPVVSAASILAKVERDKAIEKLKKKMNYDFGVGYPHDERTINFLEMILKKEKRWPSFVRKTWVTSELIKKDLTQSKLIQFLKLFKVRKWRSERK